MVMPLKAALSPLATVLLFRAVLRRRQRKPTGPWNLHPNHGTPQLHSHALLVRWMAQPAHFTDFHPLAELKLSFATSFASEHPGQNRLNEAGACNLTPATCCTLLLRDSTARIMSCGSELLCCLSLKAFRQGGTPLAFHFTTLR